MDRKNAYCKISIAPVRAQVRDQSELVTQLLFGDLITVHEIDEPWAKITTHSDNYHGYVGFKHIKSLVKKFNLGSDVILTGFVKQEKLSEYLSLVDIYVSPFIVNNITNRILPTKILEYMACQKPVLSTPLKGTVELLPDESFGIMYSSQNDFINSLVGLLQDPQKLNKLGTNGLLYIKKNHHWDNLSDQLISIFDELVKK